MRDFWWIVFLALLGLAVLYGAFYLFRRRRAEKAGKLGQALPRILNPPRRTDIHH